MHKLTAESDKKLNKFTIHAHDEKLILLFLSEIKCFARKKKSNLL